MKGIKKAVFILVALLVMTGGISVVTALGNTDDKIEDGVYIEGVNVGGMTAEEAKVAVNDMVSKMTDVKVSITVNNDVIDTTLTDLGYVWSNESVVDEALHVGESGNIIKRYKDKLDLDNGGVHYEIEMDITKEALMASLKTICEPYNIKAENASLEPTGSGFKIIPEKEGCEVDYKVSTDELYAYLTNEWDGESNIEFVTTAEITIPEYTTEDCEKVSNTPMGSYYTSFSTGWSYAGRNANIKNGTEKIDGTILYPGEEFSCNECLAPWTEDNGWEMAGTYVSGAVENTLGGGICQVSSTLYNALIRAELEIVERYPHSMSVSYVPLAADAALAGDYKDLVFKNNTDAPIYIQGIYSDAGTVKFNVYGHDTRPENRTIEFVSETVSTTPIKKQIEKDPTKEVGYEKVVSTGHTGYTAKLYKVVYEDGVEVSREEMHTSSYRMSPTKVVQGTKKDKDKKDKNKDKDKDTEKTTKNNDEDATVAPTEAATPAETVAQTEAAE